MKYQRFEDLPVWKAAVEVAVGVFALVEHRWFGSKGDLRSQLQRAALSISNNIAEGFERGTTAELLTFLYIARGSAGEVRSALRVATRLLATEDLKSQISDLKSQITGLIPQCESVSRQLRAWADSLQNGDIAGPRYLTDQSKAEYQQARRTTAFLEHLERIRSGDDETGEQT